MHSHFSEFNHNAGTLSHVTVNNSTCVTTKLRQDLKVTTFLRAFLCSLTQYQLGKATESALFLFYLAIVFALGRSDVENAF